FLSALTFAQIREVTIPESQIIGEIKDLSGKYITLERRDSTYITFTYKDMKYTHITEYKHFSFEDQDNALEYLYTSILGGLESKEKSEKSFDLPNYFLTVYFKKTLGVM